jgi:hypothetical protein
MEITKLERYLELKKQESDITNELNLLKREIRESMVIGDTELGGIKVSRSMRTRIDLDKERVLVALGEQGYKSCEKISEYEVILVKRA